MVVTKYLPSGANDTSFGQNGTAIVETNTHYFGTSVVALEGGKVLVAGHTNTVADNQRNDFYLMRLTSSGTLDQSFGASGVAKLDLPGSSSKMVTNDRASNILVRPDGKLIVGGISDQYIPGDGRAQSYAVVARYLPEGTLDASFGSGGIAKVIIGNNNPFGIVNVASDMAPQKDGSILFGGVVDRQMSNSQFDDTAVVLRFSPEGVPDVSFSGSGVAVVSPLQVSPAVCLVKESSSGKILVRTREGLVRLDAGGFVDPSFGEAGHVVVTANTFEGGFDEGEDGKIILTHLVVENTPSGGATFVAWLERFWPDGTRDVRFGQGGRVRVNVGPNYAPAEVRIFGNRILMAGAFGVPVDFNSPFVVRLFAFRKF